MDATSIIGSLVSATQSFGGSDSSDPSAVATMTTNANVDSLASGGPTSAGNKFTNGMARRIENGDA